MNFIRGPARGQNPHEASILVRWILHERTIFSAFEISHKQLLLRALI